MANSERLGASFSIDVTNLKAGLTQANRLIRESQSEFQAAAAGMDDWTESEEGLTAKIRSLNSITDIQRQKVDALQGEYDRLIADGLDPASREAVELRTKINNETAALNKNEAELKKQVAALEELENGSKDAGGATDEMGEKFSGLKAAGGIAVKAIAAVGAACAAAVGAFFGLAESTREARNNMAKLETGFTQAGHSAEAATNTYNELYSVLGDDGQATEAAAHLAQLADNEEDLAKWTNIATGVYATFGDSLPIEGLTEAANETAKTGAITGGLADALNWAGVSEDEFQASLDACATEQERQALITSTLNGLYADSAEAYRENNAEVIAAQKAQAELNAALNELGAIAEPIMTTLKTLAADLLTTITPFVQLMGEGLAGALNGTAGAADSLAQGLSGIVTSLLEKIVSMIPFIIETIVAIIPTLINSILGQLPAILQMVIDVVMQVINALTTMYPQIITAVYEIIPKLITALVSAIPQLLQAAIQLLMAIVEAIPTVITNLIAALPSVVQAIIDAVLTAFPLLIQAAIQLFMAIVQAIPTIITTLVQNLPLIINAIIDGVLNALPLLLQAAVDLLMAIVQAIPTIISLLIVEIPKIQMTITKTLLSRLPDLIKGAVQLLMGIVKAIPTIIVELVKQVPTIIKTIVSGLKDGISNVLSIGKDLVRGLWDGISSSFSWIKSKIKGWVGDVMKFIKKLFGINSPSKLMADVVGKNLALGIGVGFEKSIGAVNKQIGDAMTFDDPSVNVNATNSGIKGGGVTVYQTNNYKQAYTSQIEKYKSKQQLFATARLIKAGAI